jgi:hypothetical protein
LAWRELREDEYREWSSLYKEASSTLVDREVKCTSQCIRFCIYIYIYIYVCIDNTHTHTHIYICIHICMYVVPHTHLFMCVDR